MEFALLAAFICYFAFLIAVGIFVHHKNKNASDYMLGGRSTNYWVTAIATQSSDMGSWLFLAFPAAVYLHGIFEFWTAIGLIIFMFLTWQFIAPKLRRATAESHSLTLSSFFEHRFKDRSGILQILSASLSLLFFTFYIASGLVGLGRLFESAFAITFHAGILITLATVSLFTLVGGYISVIWCNMFQGIFLMLVILFVPIWALFKSPTPIDMPSTTTILHSFFGSYTKLSNALLLALGWGLGYFGQPHILINFMGIDDPNKINSAKKVGMIWMIVVLSAAAAIGLIATLYFTHLPNPELLFIILSKELFYPFFTGLALCGILAATLSTMDTQILISGSTFATDLFHRLINKHASQTIILNTARLGSLLISLLALAIAWNNSSSVYALVNYAWSGLGSTFGPLTIAALYLPFITRVGAICGLLTGGFIAAIWPFVNSTILPVVPGFAANFLIMLLVSRITRK